MFGLNFIILSIFSLLTIWLVLITFSESIGKFVNKNVIQKIKNIYKGEDNNEG